MQLRGNTTLSDPDVYQNGYELHDSPDGKIMVGRNSMGIRSVQPSQSGTYTLKAANGASIKIRLNVIGTANVYL